MNIEPGLLNSTDPTNSMMDEIPDSQMLILSENTQTQVILKWGTEEGGVEKVLGLPRGCN